MDAFVSRKRKRDDAPHESEPCTDVATPAEEESTDFKLALLASLHPTVDETTLLEALLASDGAVDQASTCLTERISSPRKRTSTATGYQSSLSAYRLESHDIGPSRKPLVKKGKTLFLFSPEDVEQHTPCSIIHNFLPPQQANALLLQLLDQTPTYQSPEFKLFDRVVTSAHTYGFYVNSLADAEEHQAQYTYNGRNVENIQQSTPLMLAALPQIEQAVNAQIRRRTALFHPNAKKLPHQSPHPWHANTAFVNCYAGPNQHVGYHTDQLTYLGPCAVIASLSLGVAREFRVRRIHNTDATLADALDPADARAQISINLPHNSLLVMHAAMQEHWKHAIAPAASVVPHPLAGNTRLNITYRYYKPALHPRYTPRCRCGVACVLRCATKKVARGRYMWMCDAERVPGQRGCGFVQWAVFDDDGEPVWSGAAAAAAR